MMNLPEYTVMIGDMKSANKFANTCSYFTEEIDVVQGRYTVSASSILGILALDISRPMKVIFHDEESDPFKRTQFEESIRNFIVGV